MAGTTTLSRLERLEWLTSRLKADEPMILRDIAQELGVSLRSINRDIQILRERGLPIEADRGRGGGVRLEPNWGVGKITLNHQEAVNLLISIAVMEKMENALLMTHLLRTQRKVMASFSKAHQRKIKKLRERIRVGPPSSQRMMQDTHAVSNAINNKLQQAFLLMQKVKIHYRSVKNEVTKRTVEPHFLVLNYPIWYVLCWDELRSDVRTFRLDRIHKTELINDDFTLRPYTDFEESMQGNEVIIP